MLPVVVVPHYTVSSPGLGLWLDPDQARQPISGSNLHTFIRTPLLPPMQIDPLQEDTTNSSLAKALREDKHVLIYFHSAACNLCKSISAVVDKV